MRLAILLAATLPFSACDAEPEQPVEPRYYTDTTVSDLAAMLNDCMGSETVQVGVNFNIDGPPGLTSGLQPWTLIVFGHSSPSGADCLAKVME